MFKTSTRANEETFVWIRSLVYANCALLRTDRRVRLCAAGALRRVRAGARAAAARARLAVRRRHRPARTLAARVTLGTLRLANTQHTQTET